MNPSDATTATDRPDSLRPRHRPAPVPDGGFAVWAPGKDRVDLHLDGTDHPMQPHPGGWWHVAAPRTPGARYGFLLTSTAADSTEPATVGPFPDPRSARLPDGVHGLSQVHELDPTRWTDAAWTGRPLAGQVIYELHVGTFTPGGTLRSAIDRLDELVELGITVVELMPLASFDGTHGWGYDGVSWFSVHEHYGGPDALQDFVDAAHTRGLAVYLDVVYNHFGPSGNYMSHFGPYVSASDGPWGQSLNLDGQDAGEVRGYIIDNALRWLETFHLDGLRLDAVHALHDGSAVHLLEELQVAVASLSTHLGRPLSLVAESDQNDPRMVTSREGGGYGLAGQWDDDVHHAVHAAVSGERQGYYADFGSLEVLQKVLTRVFLHDGTWSSFRGRVHGRPVDLDRVPGSRYVAYTLTHDQVGNRAAGDRPSMNLTSAQLLAKAALVLCSPFTPMLFQGEEWGASTPFCFFTSFPDPELGEAVRTGRRREFAEMGWDPADVADPQDPETYRRSQLDWSERDAEPHAVILETYRALLRLRREESELTDPWLTDIRVEIGTEAPDDRWIVVRRGSVALAVNLGTEPCRVPVTGEMLLASDAVAEDDSTFCQAFGFAVLRTS